MNPQAKLVSMFVKFIYTEIYRPTLSLDKAAPTQIQQRLSSEILHRQTMNQVKKNWIITLEKFTTLILLISEIHD